MKRKQNQIHFPTNQHKGSDIWLVGVVAVIGLGLLVAGLCIAVYLYHLK